MQADTWPGSANDGFAGILQRLAARARTFGKPVLVVQGDSHVYRVDQPLLTADAVHGITEPVPNLTRLVVQGATTSEWLKLRVDPKGARALQLGPGAALSEPRPPPASLAGGAHGS